MISIPLSHFADRVRLKSRITYGDVQRLKRDVLPDGIESREEAELLLDLDREIDRADGSWGSSLVVMFIDFVVWAERPTGVIGDDTADWISAALAGPEGARPTKTGRSIARAISDERTTLDEDLGIPLPGVLEDTGGHLSSEVDTTVRSS